mmetsp:Transcript_59853/g.125086  ORF Transcript_59853/g.125086 Transcript_59853/m.125086 type:complete len:214 (+) Transcript_59853:351-992(+)
MALLDLLDHFRLESSHLFPQHQDYHRHRCLAPATDPHPLLSFRLRFAQIARFRGKFAHPRFQLFLDHCCRRFCLAPATAPRHAQHSPSSIRSRLAALLDPLAHIHLELSRLSRCPRCHAQHLHFQLSSRLRLVPMALLDSFVHLLLESYRLYHCRHMHRCCSDQSSPPSIEIARHSRCAQPQIFQKRAIRSMDLINRSHSQRKCVLLQFQQAD